MSGEKQTVSDNTAEKNLIELLTLEAPQAEWIIRRLARGEINREEARLEMHELSTTAGISVRH